MSQARQPFSRGAVVTGVKAKRSAVKHPPELKRSVDTRRVKWEIVKPWIAARVTELLTVEDDVLIAMIYNLLEQDQVHKNGVYVYSQLQTFLEKHTDVFMRELWDMLVSANANPSGIPQKFIDEKAAELRQQKAVADELRRRQRESDDAARRLSRGSEVRMAGRRACTRTVPLAFVRRRRVYVHFGSAEGGVAGRRIACACACGPDALARRRLPHRLTVSPAHLGLVSLHLGLV